MANNANSITVADLERLLDVKKRRRAGLLDKRTRLERRLNAVFIQIDRIRGADRKSEAPRPRKSNGPRTSARTKKS